MIRIEDIWQMIAPMVWLVGTVFGAFYIDARFRQPEARSALLQGCRKFDAGEPHKN